ncbi:MAG: homocysteine S-methyltransferase family protein [Bacteroidetes bacterium]|nr:homocysteine S-methyltransferase family protein [Bacteroidota bacterium]
MTLTELLVRKSVVILDGAMGTELHREGVDIGLPLWSANALIRAPHVVRNLHYAYLHAGADILTTNTFRTNIRTLRRKGFENRWEELNLRAVELAFEARERYHPARPVLVAGGLAPVEECYSPELVPSDAELIDEHGRQAELLAMFGADMLLVETMMTMREAVAAAAACAATGKEFAVSFVCTHDGALLSGESLVEAVDALRSHKPAAIMINCVSALHIGEVHRRLRAVYDGVTGCYANTGTPEKGEATQTRHDVTPEEYAARSGDWVSDGARIVGGCCGTSAEHITLLTRRHSPETLRLQEEEISAWKDARARRWETLHAQSDAPRTKETPDS